MDARRKTGTFCCEMWCSCLLSFCVLAPGPHSGKRGWFGVKLWRHVPLVADRSVADPLLEQVRRQFVWISWNIWAPFDLVSRVSVLQLTRREGSSCNQYSVAWSCNRFLLGDVGPAPEEEVRTSGGANAGFAVHQGHCR